MLEQENKESVHDCFRISAFMYIVNKGCRETSSSGFAYCASVFERGNMAIGDGEN